MLFVKLANNTKLHCLTDKHASWLVKIQPHAVLALNPGVRNELCVPFVAGKIVVDACLHVLKCIQCCKHVDQLGKSQEVRLRDKVLPLLRVGKCSNLFTEAIGGIVDKSHQLLCLEDLRPQNLDCLLVNLHTVCLLMSLDLTEGKEI